VSRPRSTRPKAPARSRRRRLLRWAAILAIGAVFVTICWFFMIRMPGQSHRGPLPPVTPAETALAAAMKADVEALAVTIGRRNVWEPARYAAAASLVETALRGAGQTVTRIPFDGGDWRPENVEGALPGTSAASEIVVVGAHYDSVRETVGANDNGSGVAALLALARAFAGKPAARSLRFVAFANEEPPWFQTDKMGSLVYARACRERGDRVTAMISLETIGFYSDGDGSQDYPFPFGFFYPSRGNFVTFVGNLGSRALVRETISIFRETTQFPSEGGALPGWIPGVGWSDHWSFWKAGYPAVMITDTAPFRYPHYHTSKDTADKLDYERMARVVVGVERVVRRLAGGAQ
jgi:Zn-dependent M28 family amino/carboxypeptidase